MKRTTGILLTVQMAMILAVVIIRLYCCQYNFAVMSCVSDVTAKSAVVAAGFNMSEDNERNVEDMVMQIVYQLARRSVVKVTVKDAAGSGIIWKIEDGIVIASNRHLLLKDVRAEVTFGNQETVNAVIMGYSQQYDIGFIKIPEEAVTDSILRDIYETVPVLYESELENAKKAFGQSYAGKRILQVGAVIDKGTVNFSSGSIRGLTFIPLFNTNVLETECFSRAGMSGGGVFDEYGRFLGMISGGDVPENSEKREAELTYSIPPVLIESEYRKILEDTAN
ncbi:MAG: serine protease [Lachnospiraceae bacterium]|nr:serine protease [Lachnospiraceae bacterium]